MRDKSGIWALVLTVPSKSRIPFIFKGIPGTSLRHDGTNVPTNVLSRRHLFSWIALVMRFSETVAAFGIHAQAKVLSNGVKQTDMTPTKVTETEKDIPF